MTERRTRGVVPGMVVGFLLSFPVIAAGIGLYLRYGHPPVAVADPAFPEEAAIVHVPLEARIAREMQSSPIAGTAENLLGGAHVYGSQCAFCHGTPGVNSDIGANEYPSAPQLWKKHAHGDVVGVSDDPVGETYWKVANGIRLTGMPAFDHSLSATEMWQVSLLLAQADKPQTPEVLAALRSSVAEVTPPAPGNDGAGAR